jgi:diguanylate cyclase (GGDEF)-like protein
MFIETGYLPSLLIISIIVIVSCGKNLKTSLLISVSLSVLFIALFHSSFAITAPTLLIYNTLPLIGMLFKKGLDEERGAVEAHLKSTADEYRHLLDSYSSSKSATASLSRAATEMEHLYEITRKMSEALEFNKIFKIFNDFLNRGIRFRECKFLIIGKENDTFFIEKTIKMSHPLASDEKEVQVLSPELKDEIALDLFYEDQRPRFLSGPRDSERLRMFYPKEDIKSLAANPLIVEDELIGILLLEDLIEKDFEKFLILAGQLALEIKKVRLYETIQKLAIFDGLTGVYMRRHFLERVDEEVKRADYHKLNISFLMVDIDHFKACNDRYGHLVGDVVLSEIAGILKKNVREIDIICRYGGEEFAIALPDTGKKAATLVAERIRVMVQDYKFRAFDETPRVTVSIGISSYPADGKTMVELIEAADKALYTAKHSGRNMVCVYEAGCSKDLLT